MKFVLIVGPQAVGKMTVGQELEKITDLKLFHNHMTIEMVTPFFSYGTAAGKRLVKLFREEIFKEVANSDLSGLIFTFVCAFDVKEDMEYVDEICGIFESRGGTVYFVELEAHVGERLERNKSSNRLEQKPTKRNIEWSERDLLESMEMYRLNSLPGEINREHYMRINNTNLSAEQVAKMIKERFEL
ncbi:AAA family ATPase [Bacillus sp. FJAT-49711]|uniref:AAA family ATPase n=1 Tax=Bacillus sp. FJAT-49711 TaxID=2833585 RepID=UPI001BC95954|nr:AAA family ATPase [Bacillus sp. FJAT-49711]MBS4218256.1 AAA family ATPase [Bacillus sp. FJAT-49711]